MPDGTRICIEEVGQSNVGLKSVMFVIRKISQIIMARFSSKDILSKSIKITRASDISKEREQNKKQLLLQTPFFYNDLFSLFFLISSSRIPHFLLSEE